MAKLLIQGSSRVRVVNAPKCPAGARRSQRAEQGVSRQKLVKCGIPEKRAKALLSNVSEGQEVMDQLEWGTV
jgi:hypothetical protein